MCAYFSDLILPAFKYLAFNFVWVFIGFFFGLSVYWCRIGQVRNEVESILNLFLYRYSRGDKFTLRAGVDVKSFDGSSVRMVNQDCKMIFGYERGVDWFFCSSRGLIRSRVLYASFENDAETIPKYYIVSHTYILK